MIIIEYVQKEVQKLDLRSQLVTPNHTNKKKHKHIKIPKTPAPRPEIKNEHDGKTANNTRPICHSVPNTCNNDKSIKALHALFSEHVVVRYFYTLHPE